MTEVRALALLLASIAAVGAARAEPGAATTAPRGAELAGSIGVVTAMTGQTVGGVRIAGEYDRPLGAVVLDLHGAAVLGANERACYFDRRGRWICDHGSYEGTSIALGAGIIWRFGTAPGGLFARAGGELAIASFADDDTSGFLLLLRAGGGYRHQLSPKLAFTVEGILGFGLTSLEGRRSTEVDGSSVLRFELLAGLAFPL